MSNTYSNNYFEFNGVKSSDYGIFINGAGTFGAPERDMEVIEIPGRHGVLTIDHGRFKSVKHTYRAFVNSSFDSNIKGLRNALMAIRGQAVLTDTFHPGEYYKAYYECGLDPNVTDGLEGATFDISFTRSPQRWLTAPVWPNWTSEPFASASGDAANSDGTYTRSFVSGDNLPDEGYIFLKDAGYSDIVIGNSHSFASAPIIRVTGATIGDRITINGIRVNIGELDADESVYLDCETMQASSSYLMDDNLIGSKVALRDKKFPALEPGENTFSFGSFLKNVAILPRYWDL